MGGWANYRYYMLNGRYRDAEDFKEMKRSVSVFVETLERLWKYSIEKRDRNMEILITDALEEHGYNFKDSKVTKEETK